MLGPNNKMLLFTLFQVGNVLGVVDGYPLELLGQLTPQRVL